MKPDLTAAVMTYCATYTQHLSGMDPIPLFAGDNPPDGAMEPQFVTVVYTWSTTLPGDPGERTSELKIQTRVNGLTIGTGRTTSMRYFSGGATPEWPRWLAELVEGHRPLI